MSIIGRSDPPPVIVMPWSMMSAAISGCVFSSATDHDDLLLEQPCILAWRQMLIRRESAGEYPVSSARPFLQPSRKQAKKNPGEATASPGRLWVPSRVD
jgi:hypothetical protein